MRYEELIDDAKIIICSKIDFCNSINFLLSSISHVKVRVRFFDNDVVRK